MSRKDLVQIVSIIALIFACAFAGKYGAALVAKYEGQFRLDHLPATFGSAKVIYFKEEARGIGGLPGDNETGLFVYEISIETANQIQTLGTKFFGKPGVPLYARHRLNHYFDWQPTPVSGLPSTRTGCGASHKGVNFACTHLMENYLAQYGLSIPVDPIILESINTALSKPGSFVGQGRHGLLIVVPASHRVIYAYSG